ncbi:MAG: outer membrane lipoprotein-sorting protein [Acidobacteriota bacterium]
MRRSLLIFFLSLSFLTTVPAEDSPREIIDKVDRIMRGDSSYGVAEMVISTKRWKRSKTIEIWSEGTEKALIRLLQPQKEKGVATLKIESDIWNYLPKISRTIRIPSSMMMASWMGSHFSNDDLVKESRLIDDYTIETTFEGTRDGTEIWEFRLTPDPDAPVVWGGIVYVIRKNDLMPIKADFYDEDETLKRTVTYSDYKIMGGRLIPATMNLVPSDKPEEYTRIIYTELAFDMKHPSDTFSLSSLREK